MGGVEAATTLVLATPRPNTGWGIGMCSDHEEKRKGRQNASLSLSSSLERMLTDDIRFRHRTGSRSQMSRSGNYRAVLGTSWRSWRDRLSALLPSSVLSGSFESAEDGEEER